MKTNKLTLGFACICTDLGSQGNTKTLTVKQASKMDEKTRRATIKDKMVENLDNILSILYYCKAHKIGLYRVSSKTVVLNGHELNNFAWWADKDVLTLCEKIRTYAKDNNIRLTTHPDQFNVINAKDEKIFENTCKTLTSEAYLCYLLGIETMCIHVGGVYGDKEASKRRFINNFYLLPPSVQDILCIENDDKSYNVEDALEICEAIGRPVIVDYHHDRILPSIRPLGEYIERVKATWRGQRPKCHLSTGKDHEKHRTHAHLVTMDDFRNCLEVTRGEFDIMLECNGKERGIREILKNL